MIFHVMMESVSLSTAQTGAVVDLDTLAPNVRSILAFVKTPFSALRKIHWLALTMVIMLYVLARMVTVDQIVELISMIVQTILARMAEDVLINSKDLNAFVTKERKENFVKVIMPRTKQGLRGIREHCENEGKKPEL